MQTRPESFPSPAAARAPGVAGPTPARAGQVAGLAGALFVLAALAGAPTLAAEGAANADRPAASPAGRPVDGPAPVITPLPEAHTGSPTTKSLDFDKTFSSRGEPATLHYRATYQGHGAEHSVEVWRAGDTKVRRSADGLVDTFVFKPGKDAEWHMVVLDQKRKLRSDVDRTALFKVGRFLDWFSFGHAIGHPTGVYTLVAGRAPDNLPEAIAPCTWYVLTRDGHDASLCWSQQYRIPLLIAGAGGKAAWKVTAVLSGKLPADAFTIQDAGYIRNNASQDIEGD